MTSLSFPSLVLWFAPEEGVPGPCQRLVQPDHPMQVAQERKVFWFDDTALRPPLPARPRPTLAPPVPKSMPRRYGPSVITMVLSRAGPAWRIAAGLSLIPQIAGDELIYPLQGVSGRFSSGSLARSSSVDSPVRTTAERIPARFAI